MKKTFELSPSMGSCRKSFYGKATVTEDGDVATLRSYRTDVCKIINGKLIKLWDGYSATTMRHIQSFCHLYGVDCGGKKWWENYELKEEL